MITVNLTTTLKGKDCCLTGNLYFMKKLTAVILLLILVISCTSNTIYKKPNDLISEDLMVNLIVDMQIANSARNTKNKEGIRKLEYMPLVYEKFGIDSARFARSNFYYSTKIDDYSKLLKKVKAKLENMERDFSEQVEIQDSIKNIGNIKYQHLKEREKVEKEMIDKSGIVK